MSIAQYEQETAGSERVARAQEALALQSNLELLQLAQAKGAASPEAAAALHATRQVWNILIEDLGQPGNQLPKQLRADLISIGLWVLREAEAIRTGRTSSFAGIIEVTEMIRKGLS
jgi:flagellar biosynthesis activator protein FlaF